MKITSRYSSVSIALSLLIAIGPIVAITPANAATPKPGATCKQAGQQVTASNLVYTCNMSGKKLVWSKGVKKSSGNAASNQSNSGAVTEGVLCDSSKDSSGRSSSGAALVCTKGSDGKYSWRPPQTGGSGSGNGSGNGNGSNPDKASPTDDKTYLYGKRLGMSCSKDGVFGLVGGALAICSNAKVRYALPTDIPATPSGGYKTRPSWYPTLAQQLGESEPTCAPSSIKFTSPVIPLDQIAPIIPYGAMIGGHVTPIDHAYLGLKPLYKATASRTESDYVSVTAPADGIITELSSLGSPTSHRVVIRHGCNVVSVYMVLNRPSGVLASYAAELASKGSVNVNVAIKAGQEFGQQRDNALDFNVFDGTSWLSGFANPFSYTSQDQTKPYTANPLPFFTPAIQAAYQAQLQRATGNRMGKIDYDVIGAASGNWFLNGTIGYSGNLITTYQNATSLVIGGSVAGKNDYSWSHLAIAPEPVDTTKWIFSTGWWTNPDGDATQVMFNIADGQITPDKLTAASGLVAYQLVTFVANDPPGSPTGGPGYTIPHAVGYTVGAGTVRGVVGLQVNTDGSLSVEINTSMTSASQFTGFTSAKRIYRR
ncbi:unannotated protein [freshwater metagenome]|uniref:Unannotated protein n=1 Tax=freshwater metagenome TaxID=449393 RepID=A0A6J6LPE9_9ZZZZ|nr:hypothetical protein [Actinomycetota bacterium]